LKPAWIAFGTEDGQETPTGQCVIIGFDYGATFSGIGYLLVDHAHFRAQTLPESLIGRVKVLPNYKDQEDYHSKYVVPTVVTYDRSGSNRKPLRWGFPAWKVRRAQDGNIHKVELAKLLFSRHHNKLDQVKSLRKIAKELNKNDIDFAADFLTLLNEKVENELPLVYPDYAAAPRYYYCGVPAGWNEEKAAFADACDKAGLLGTILVSESEAAANAMLALSDRPVNVRTYPSERFES